MAVRIESQAEPLPGYRLIERLGGGGFGEVWKAEAPGGLHKAIKFVYGDLQEASEEGLRAEQELKALSRVKTVRHPFILNLERYDIIDGQLIIVMELADRNLWDRYKECRAAGLPGIPRAELLGYLDETAEALDLMNSEYQLQHLDIKPQNLFLVHNHVKVADFGLVKDLEGMVASVTGGVTPVYAAPETFDGWVSRFSDQYSLAIVYQELLTGQRPFTGVTVRQLVLQHLQGRPELAPLPAADRPIVARGLAKNPEERHPTCRALVEALHHRSTVAVPAPAAPPAEPEAAPPVAADLAAGDLAASSPGVEVAEPFSIPAQKTSTCWIRPQEEAGRRPQPTRSAEGRQPAVVQGDGVLFPSLVIALGGLGLSILRQLRHCLHSRFGSLDSLPNCRLLCLDTDPSVLRSATRGSAGSALSATDIVLARLNRPSHYLKSRDSLDSWIDSRMIYRIPRSLETGGVRALGRLAFSDNYSTIARRVRQELEACTGADVLQAAAGRSGLSIRTNRPRVYLLTSLTGGSGSGMFLDMAYVVRRTLKDMGYGEPDVVGLFLLPAVDRQSSRPASLGNAFAALTELNHFSAPSSTFSAVYRSKDAKVQETGAPFNRCVLLPMAEPGNEVGARELIELAGQFLFRDLTHPLGRAVDLARFDLPSAPREARGPVCQTFGMYRVSFPRQPLVREAARTVCLRLVERWMNKDSKPLRPAVQEWTEKQWVDLGLGVDSLIPQLQRGGEQALGKVPETAFATILEPLGARPAEPTAGARLLRGAPSPAPAPGPDPERVAEILQKLERLVGKPDDTPTPNETSLLPEALSAAADKLVSELERRLAELLVSLIEKPAFRLAGAEEAIRQLGTLIEKALEHHEPLCRELTARATETYQRVKAAREALAKDPPAARRPAVVNELLEAMRLYPKWRYQSLVLQQVARAYVSLRGGLSDQLREVNFCRNRLSELARSFGNKPDAEEQPDGKASLSEMSVLSPAAGRALFPTGCWSLNDAVDQLLGSVQADDLHELDDKVQQAIHRKLTALVYVCLTSTNFLKNLEVLMLQEVEQFVDGRLGGINVAEMFLERFGRDEAGGRELESAFDKAAPKLGGSLSGKQELNVVAVPPGASGERFRELARGTLGADDVALVSSPDDIVIYRELPRVNLTDLEQLGPLGYEAYRQMVSSGHSSPHSRGDITQWRAASRLEAVASGQ